MYPNGYSLRETRLGYMGKDIIGRVRLFKLKNVNGEKGTEKTENKRYKQA